MQLAPLLGQKSDILFLSIFLKLQKIAFCFCKFFYKKYCFIHGDGISKRWFMFGISNA